MQLWEATIKHPQHLSTHLKATPPKLTAHLYHSTINTRPPQHLYITHISTPSKPPTLTRSLIPRPRAHLISTIMPRQIASSTSASLAPVYLPSVYQRSATYQKTQIWPFPKIRAINFSRMRMDMCSGSRRHQWIRYRPQSPTRLSGTLPDTWRRKFV